METRTQINVTEVDMICPKCSIGFMRGNEMVIFSDPVKYPHICENCGYEENYTVEYPSIEKGDKK